MNSIVIAPSILSLDYANVSRRWSMPGRYYTKVFEKKGTAIRL